MQDIRALLPRWAAQAEFVSSVGEPLFRTTNAIFRDFKLWVTDDANDVQCVEVVSRARVKRSLDGLYSDQVHRGDRRGLQRQTGAGNHHLWNFGDVDPLRPVGTDGARFEREMVKLAFSLLNCDASAALSGELTPAQRTGLQPSSVTQIAYALADVCAGAPDFATLCAVTRDVIKNELGRCSGAREPSSSHERVAKQQRGQHNSPIRSAARSLAAFSPHLEPPTDSLSLHDQVRCRAPALLQGTL